MSTLTKFTGGMQLGNKVIYSRAGLQSRSTWMGWSNRSTGTLWNSSRTNVQSSTERGGLPYSGTGVGWGGKGAHLWEGPRGLVGITRAEGVLGCVNRSLSGDRGKGSSHQLSTHQATPKYHTQFQTPNTEKTLTKRSEFSKGHQGGLDWSIHPVQSN